VSKNTIAIDAAIAVALAGLVLVIAPGIAVAGLVAIAALIVCGLSLALDRRGVRARGPRRTRDRRAPQGLRPPRDGRRRGAGPFS
jgi:hypothetical protein